MYRPFFDFFEYIGDKVVYTTIPNFYYFDDDLELPIEYDVDEFYARLTYVDPRVSDESLTLDEKIKVFHSYSGKTMRRTKSSYVRDMRYLARNDHIPEQKIGFTKNREKNRVSYRTKSWYARAHNRDRHRNRAQMRLNSNDESDYVIPTDSEQNDETIGPCVTRVITLRDFF